MPDHLPHDGHVITPPGSGEHPQHVRRVSDKVVLRSNRMRAQDPVQITVDPAPSGQPVTPKQVSEDCLEQSDSMVPAANFDRHIDDFLNRSYGPFQIHSFLGGGTFGFVFHARDVLRGRWVALKVLRGATDRIDGVVRVDQFKREASVQRKMSYHPNVVQVFDVGEHEGLPYLAMEYISDGSLYDRVQNGPALQLPVVCRWFAQIAEVLAVMHREGIVHRDIKPPNLMLKDRTIKLGDFGLVRVEPIEGTPWPTESVGSPMYAAPEIRADRAADARSDLYSLGASLFYAMTAHHPYKAARNRELRALHKTAPVPDPRQYHPNLPAAVAEVPMRCMQKDPAERFHDAEHLAETLNTLADKLHVG